MSGAPGVEEAPVRFWPTARRLLSLLRPFRLRMLGAVAATCAFAGLNVAAPKYLGDATDVVVDGVSLISSYRSQFNSIIRTSSFARLLETLESREALLSPGSSR